ncbi:MAG TPA: hypothetical protein VGP68_06250 [Gemmataceae bacterium]|nr:hypothetical protein [Gemmataceae bacterium]
MVFSHYVLAVVLLSNPPGTADPPNLASMHAQLSRPLQTIAVQWQILDKREVKDILSRPEDFLSDLALVRRRYRDLANAPAVEDSQRFPDRAQVNDLLAFNRAFRQYIDVRQPVELVHWWELRVTLQETERLYQIWDQVRDANCDYYYVGVRRGALKKLRELVGDEAYYSGNLPPVVPSWRFRSND